jgi:NADH-quinone oxidoreductase subunit J
LNWEAVIFYAAAALAVGAGLVVVLARKLINAAFALLAAFGGVAVLYGLLGAAFLAGAQLLLYIGGILVLILFAIVLTRDIESARITMTGTQRVLALLTAAVTTVLLVVCFGAGPFTERAADLQGPGPQGIGQLFMEEYILPFEVVSVLLLIALLGASYMARRKS